MSHYDAREKYTASQAAIREFRKQLRALHADLNRLLLEQTAIDQRVAEMEASYFGRTGQLLVAAGD